MAMARQRWEVSDSEAESEAETPDTPPGTGGRSGETAGPGKMTKFECPPDFTPCPRSASRDLTLEKVNDPSTELWLIKAPADFDPQSFSGRKIPLVGFQTLKSKTCRDRLYNVFGTDSGTGGVCLVLPSEAAGRAASCPPFAGCINIGESWEDTSDGGQPHSIPASPAPSIPEGLKLRFRPFGAAPPGRSPRKRPEPGDEGGPGTKRRKRMEEKTVVDGCKALLETADPEAPGDVRKKKKKRSKEPEEEDEHSDRGATTPEHGKRKKRRKGEAGEIPRTPPREMDLGHKKKKKKKDKY
ncbi:CD3e molecule, epsilon associated protein [Heptranchias perlo]|uniref:CD3e molecule, epsilon associated protein n=1 Tax=Heptranchias perlo TaxID=212740 RepID=UPI00355AB1EB